MPLWPVFVSYILSFVYVGIYWNNHHNMLHAARRVSGGVLWGNLHLLFWLSLIPFVTSWMGNTHFAGPAVAAYGVILFLCATAWSILAWLLLRAHGPEDPLSRALRRRGKEWLSTVLYLVAVLLAFRLPYVACAIYWVVAIIWFVPDKRFEEALEGES